MPHPTIRIGTPQDAVALAEIIRISFRDVAERFGLTQGNCPTHPSNCTVDWVHRDIDRDVIYFILEAEGIASGCVALELASSELCYLERLAVLPSQRRCGFGKALVDFVIAEAERFGAHRVSIGIIAGQKELKNWYKKAGFVETETKEFAHLPFQVTFMIYEINRNC